MHLPVDVALLGNEVGAGGIHLQRSQVDGVPDLSPREEGLGERGRGGEIVVQRGANGGVILEGLRRPCAVGIFAS